MYSNTAHKKVKGFTLLEILIVFAITMVLVSISIGGLTYLQNSVTLDNAIRDIKVEIQSAQSNARNSLVVRPGQSTNNLATNDISVGWVFKGINSTNGITITKRSVYFKPGTYDVTLLREDIRSLFVNSVDQSVHCRDAAGDLYLYKANSPVTLSGRSIFCTKDASANTNDFSRFNIPGARLVNTTSGLPLCNSMTIPGDSALSNSLFFTSGYGETISNASSVPACQISIEKSGFLGNKRAIRINKNTGSVVVCGNYCT